MSTPDPNEPTRINEAIRARLPHRQKPPLPPAEPPEPPAPVIPVQPYEERPIRRPFSGFLPAFWTIASLISMVVNVVLIAMVLILYQMLGDLQRTANDQISGLLGGLYQNFALMEQAVIERNIPVKADVPVTMTVPVQATDTRITLSRDAVISNARVQISEGGVQINARAVVTLPADTPLNVNIERFELPVHTTIPVQLDVGVKIPLAETQLQQPFQGLQNVVHPWYCLIEPNAQVLGNQICSPFFNPEGTGADTP
jgi:hypothetical protein